MQEISIYNVSLMHDEDDDDEDDVGVDRQL